MHPFGQMVFNLGNDFSEANFQGIQSFSSVLGNHSHSSVLDVCINIFAVDMWQGADGSSFVCTICLRETVASSVFFNSKLHT